MLSNMPEPRDKLFTRLKTLHTKASVQQPLHLGNTTKLAT